MRRETIGPADVGLIIGGYRIPAARSSDSPALAVLARILASGETSRLNERIVQRDGTGMRPGSIFRVLAESGQLLFYSGYRRITDGPKVEAAIKEEVARLAKSPVDSYELALAKNQLVAQAIFDAEDVAGLASRLGAAAVVKGDALAGLLANDKVKDVTAKDVLRVAKAYLGVSRLTIVVMPPFPDVDPAAATGGKP